MSRPQLSRKISEPPKMKGYKPFGIHCSELETINLSYEEFESVRLINYEKLSQEAAAYKMEISRPTFTRLYNKALNTIVKAFVEGKAIEISGGNFQLDEEWFRCGKCFKLIEGMNNHVKCKKCTVFSGKELIKIT